MLACFSPAITNPFPNLSNICQQGVSVVHPLRRPGSGYIHSLGALPEGNSRKECQSRQIFKCMKYISISFFPLRLFSLHMGPYVNNPLLVLSHRSQTLPSCHMPSCLFVHVDMLWVASSRRKPGLPSHSDTSPPWALISKARTT